MARSSGTPRSERRGLWRFFQALFGPRLPSGKSVARAAIGIPSRRSVYPDDNYGFSLNRDVLTAAVPARVITRLRELAMQDEDISGAVRDLEVLANPGFRVVVTGQSHTRAEKDLNELLDGWFPGGSFDAFLNNQIFELVVSGASSVEWYPDKTRSGVGGIAVIPGELIEIQQGPNDTLRYYQTQQGLRDPILLSPLTYHYAPVQTIGANPYGVSLMLTALSALDRKYKMLGSLDRMLKILGLAGIVHASVPLSKPEDLGYDSEADPAYQDYVEQYMRDIAEQLYAGEEEGVFATPQGVEINVISASRDISGAMTAWVDNEHRVWSGARTLPFMRGRSESLSETWAKVAFPILLAEAKNIQLVLKSQIEFGLNLHLRLRGYRSKAEILFEKPESPFRESDARTGLLEAQRDQILTALYGQEYLDSRRITYGLSGTPPPRQNPREEPPQAPSPEEPEQNPREESPQDPGSNEPV